jgi:hypothetical protein
MHFVGGSRAVPAVISGLATVTEDPIVIVKKKNCVPFSSSLDVEIVLAFLIQHVEYVKSGQE